MKSPSHNLDMDRIYLFLSSNDSLDCFPDNTPAKFTVKLPETMYLNQGAWVCTLIDLKCQTLTLTDLYVFCDVVKDSYVRNRKLPILQQVPKRTGGHIREYFGSSVVLGLTRHVFNSVTMYIKDADMNTPSFTKEPVTCTLCFFKN